MALTTTTAIKTTTIVTAARFRISSSELTNFAVVRAFEQVVVGRIVAPFIKWSSLRSSYNEKLSL